MRDIHSIHNWLRSSLHGWDSWWEVSWPYTMQISNWGSLSSPANASNYYFGNALQWTTIDYDDCRLYVPISWTLKKLFIEIRNTGTAGTAEQSTMYLQVIKPDWTVITHTIVTNITTNQSNNSFQNTSMSIDLAAWDIVNIKWITPTRWTKPWTLQFNFLLVIEPPECEFAWSYCTIPWWVTWYTPTSWLVTYFGDWVSSSTDTIRCRIPYKWKIVWAMISPRCSTNATIASWLPEYFFHLNWTTDTSIWTTDFASTNPPMTYNSINIDVNEWDWFNVKLVNATYTVAPTSIATDIILLLQIT